MNLIKYFKNKSQCPLCESGLIRDNGYEIFCSCCGLVVFDYDLASISELDFIFSIADNF